MKAVCQLEKLAEISPSFQTKLKDNGIDEIKWNGLEILQINITKKCNLACKHCHVQSSAFIEEHMSEQALEKCLELIELDSVTTLDITGGSPEMHPRFEWLLNNLNKTGKRIIVRTNLVILNEAPYNRFIDIYREKRVELVASLPNPYREKYDKQRGAGNYDKIIAVLNELNDRGFGIPDSGLALNLVHNPIGAFLPAKQETLEFEYKKNLRDWYGIQFNALFCIANMPVGRYLSYLINSDNFEDYTQDLIAAFNPEAAGNVMCKNTLNIAADGSIYNCDFNQMLQLPALGSGIGNILDLEAADLKNIAIAIHNHCYGCTAGSGSSCQGATA